MSHLLAEETTSRYVRNSVRFMGTNSLLKVAFLDNHAAKFLPA